MQYRPFLNNKYQVSSLGLGCMRLPCLENGKADPDESIRMIRYAIDNGINYLDTAAPYHDGDSEKILGKALKDGYREKAMIATKFPLWEPQSESDLEPIFQRQLERLDVDSIDVYLVHNIQRISYGNVRKFNMLRWLEEKKERGIIKHIGFSFHDDIELFKEVVDLYDWELCQIQYNYVNENIQAGTEGLKYAAEKGISVVIMEPLFGGVLANPPGTLGEHWRNSGKNPVDLALRWLWNKPEVSLVLSGMSNMDQLKENLEIASRSGVGSMSAEEKSLIEKARKLYDEAMPVKCTKCRYCMPCPAGIDIPLCFELYNSSASEAGHTFLGKGLYASISQDRKAENCTRCGECEPKCPQGLPIRSHIKSVTEFFK